MKVQDLLLGKKFIGSVEEARQAMFDAGEAPANYRSGRTPEELKRKNVPMPVIEQTAPVIQEAPKTVLAASVPLTDPNVKVAVTPAPKNTPERVETKDFVAEIRNERGKWVAEIVYKNGAGSEKFTATTRNELTHQLLIGKGNATIKVRKVIREQKFGIETDSSYTFEGLTQDEYDVLPQAARQKLIDAEAMKASLAFKHNHPEYINTADNWKMIKKFLDDREKPYTYNNFEFAYDALGDELEVKVEEDVKTHVVVEAPRSEDSAVVVEPAQVASAPVLETTPAPQLRKRGTTGLQPSFSSSENELELTEDGSRLRELSEAELRKLPISEHKALYQQMLAARKKNRSF